jgi:hypothetical protein
MGSSRVRHICTFADFPAVLFSAAIRPAGEGVADLLVTFFIAGTFTGGPDIFLLSADAAKDGAKLHDTGNPQKTRESNPDFNGADIPVSLFVINHSPFVRLSDKRGKQTACESDPASVIVNQKGHR